MEIIQESYSSVNDKDIFQYALKNDNGIEVNCLNFGCIITKIITPDNQGNFENIVLCFDSMEEYDQNSPYLGAVIGRVAGRIKGAEFEIDGRTYQVEKNNNENHIHGGVRGFHRVVWDTEVFEKEDEVGVHFSYTSRDGEEGYPGTVTIHVTYSLTNKNEFLIQYRAETDQTTLLNPTNHTYFNLSGNAKRDVLDHFLKLESHQFLELDEQLLPTGIRLDVADTEFDFRVGRQIKDGSKSNHPQNILAGGGYDHPFLLNSKAEMMVWDKESGRKLMVETDAPCVVLYTGNHLTEDLTLNGVKGRKHLGLCLETQCPPDAIHHPSLPSVILRSDEVYTSITKYTFLIES